VVDAESDAGDGGYVVVGAASVMWSRATAASGCQAFLRVVVHEAVGSPGVQGRGAIHFLDRTCWWGTPFPGPHEVL
jgi:hypothetical protein